MDKLGIYNQCSCHHYSMYGTVIIKRTGFSSSKATGCPAGNVAAVKGGVVIGCDCMRIAIVVCPHHFCAQLNYNGSRLKRHESDADSIAIP